jgi:hypothetical protein
MVISNKIDTVTMDRVLLPQDSLKKLGLLKINLLPINTTLWGKIVYKLPSNFYYHRPPVSGIDPTYNGSVYRKTYFFAREKFDLWLPGQ